MTTWQEYFNFSWTCEERLLSKTDENCIFAEYPHGAFPFGPLLAAGPCAIYFPGQKVRSSMFRHFSRRHIFHVSQRSNNDRVALFICKSVAIRVKVMKGLYNMSLHTRTYKTFPSLYVIVSGDRFEYLCF
jgi:hypothetical protein